MQHIFEYLINRKLTAKDANKNRVKKHELTRPVYKYVFDNGDLMIFIGLYGGEIKPYIDLLNQTQIPSVLAHYNRNFIDRYKNTNYTNDDGIIVYVCLFDDTTTKLGYNLDFETEDDIKDDIKDSYTKWRWTLVDENFHCDLKDMVNYDFYKKLLDEHK